MFQAASSGRLSINFVSGYLRCDPNVPRKQNRLQRRMVRRTGGGFPAADCPLLPESRYIRIHVQEFPQLTPESLFNKGTVASQRKRFSCRRKEGIGFAD